MSGRVSRNNRVVCTVLPRVLESQQLQQSPSAESLYPPVILSVKVTYIQREPAHLARSHESYDTSDDRRELQVQVLTSQWYPSLARPSRCVLSHILTIPQDNLFTL